MGRRGDVMSKEKRSALMSRIRGKNTGPERIVAGWFRGRRIRFNRQVRSLPGRPDFVLRDHKVVVFVEGDFWHGWRFPAWKSKLSPWWRRKIEGNRTRDGLVFARLRRRGWRVFRLWEHQIERGEGQSCRKLYGYIRPRKRRNTSTSR